ncbi:MAG: tRNA-binding protein [Acidobacteria bacterium]|nr:MAG: tRNA-binding protein [Acidobacteriota bacterium]
MAEFTPAAVKPTVGVEALDALDIHVGTIERVEDVPRSDKLMKLTVNFGDHSRTILAGIKKERENPREIEGRQALFVVNLEPRKMASEISEGMLFDIGHADALTPVLSVPERPVPNGTRAG